MKHTRHPTARVGALLLVAAVILVPAFCAGASTGVISGQVTGGGGPLTDAVVTTCTGALAKTDAKGGFEFGGLSQAMYSLRILAPGREAKGIGNIEVKPGQTTTVAADLGDAPDGGAIILGDALDADTGKPLAVSLEVTDAANAPARWFDVAGVAYGGRTDIEKGWHVKTKRAWTQGAFAVAVPPGAVCVQATRPGYETAKVTLDATAGSATPCTIRMTRFADMKALGWYAGDFHAHCVHGEGFYKVNVPFAASILRAEGYDWFYLSASHSNDGVEADYERIAREQSGPDLFLRLNTEFPKTRLGHIGNVGAPIVPKTAYKWIDRYTNVELVREFIVKPGGVPAAVHPVYRNARQETGSNKPYLWMQYNEMPFLLASAPELLKGLDIYYPAQDFDEAYEFWFMLLNRGYRFFGTASSDAAFDIGNTPGNAAKTYLYLGGQEPSEESIRAAFAAGRTFVSSGDALLDFRIGSEVSGAVLPADGAEREATVTAYCPAGASIVIELIRNGKVEKSFPVAKTVHGANRWTVAVKESEDAWYAARLVSPTAKRWCACASPIYFETGKQSLPCGVMATVKGTIVDSKTSKPVEGAVLDVVDYQATLSSDPVGSEFTVNVRPYYRLRVKAPGYRDSEKSIALDVEPIRSAIFYLTKTQLHDWATYEDMRRLLGVVDLVFALQPQ